jgi:hypothetical protein
MIATTDVRTWRPWGSQSRFRPWSIIHVLQRIKCGAMQLTIERSAHSRQFSSPTVVEVAVSA